VAAPIVQSSPGADVGARERKAIIKPPRNQIDIMRRSLAIGGWIQQLSTARAGLPTRLTWLPSGVSQRGRYRRLSFFQRMG